MEIERIQNELISELMKMGEDPKPIHTHISLVILTKEHALKIKKNVNLGFLDFTSLSNRHFYCHQELRLNKRMAEDIYLDILPIRYRDDKVTLKGGPGDVIEYAILMKRIPDENLMKNILKAGSMSLQLVERIAHHIAHFHFKTKTNEQILRFGTVDNFRINTDENFSQTQKYIGVTIAKKEWEYLKSWTDNFYLNNRSKFEQRIKENKIKDCHGDLHMEHIAIVDEKVLIFDCIEFNDRFRYGDTLNDIGFLIMDMEFNNANKEAEFLWQSYKSFTKEENVDELLTFYKVYRAYVRGKVTSFQLDGVSDEKTRDELTTKAKRYFSLALSYATQMKY